MRHAKKILIPVLLLVGVGLVVLAVRTSPANLSRNIGNDAGSTNSTPSLAERNRLTRGDRLKWLEQNGRVPDDAEYGDNDWYLAQNTSWWGKPIDPKIFWKNRVIWDDDSADLAARRHGRAYPPIPNGESMFAGLPDDAKIYWNSFHLDSRNLHFAVSSKENAFWDWFAKNRPRPPKDLALEQISAAERVMNLKGVIKKENVTKMAIILGCPVEMLTDDALSWTYVLESRKEYEQLLGKRFSTDRFLSLLVVSTNLITEPLTSDQLKAANAWKLAYLQRLRREKTDEQYIQAYLKAWKLTESEVFGPADVK